MNAFSAEERHFMTQSIRFMTSLQQPYTAKFMFVGVRNNKTQQIRC